MESTVYTLAVLSEHKMVQLATFQRCSISRKRECCNVGAASRWAGVEDPKVVVTTSRDPSARLREFAKEVRQVFPGAQRINRGKHEVRELVRACRANRVTDLLVLHEHRGIPCPPSLHPSIPPSTLTRSYTPDSLRVGTSLCPSLAKGISMLALFFAQ